VVDVDSEVMCLIIRRIWEVGYLISRRNGRIILFGLATGSTSSVFGL
jgi:hypothetical protein